MFLFLKYQEETYFTWSYSAIRDESGQIAGVLTPITETTTRVLSERRLKLLRELGNKVRERECAVVSVNGLTHVRGLVFTHQPTTNNNKQQQTTTNNNYNDRLHKQRVILNLATNASRR